MWRRRAVYYGSDGSQFESPDKHLENSWFLKTCEGNITPRPANNESVCFKLNDLCDPTLSSRNAPAESSTKKLLKTSTRSSFLKEVGPMLFCFCSSPCVLSPLCAAERLQGCWLVFYYTCWTKEKTFGGFDISAHREVMAPDKNFELKAYSLLLWPWKK